METYISLLRGINIKGKDESKQYVTFLEETPASFPLDVINKAKHDSEIVSIMGKNIYLYCPNGYGRTKLSNTFFEKKLNRTAITRNWKTVQTLKEMAAELSRERNG